MLTETFYIIRNIDLPLPKIEHIFERYATVDDAIGQLYLIVDARCTAQNGKHYVIQRADVTNWNQDGIEKMYEVFPPVALGRKTWIFNPEKNPPKEEWTIIEVKTL